MAVIETTAIITEAISQALEKMAFMVVMPPDDELLAPSITITAEISFSGPVSGTIRTAAGIDLAKVLAENISGMTELTEEQCIDVLKELVNVTCGLVLPMIATSATDVFDLTVPELTRTEERLEWEQFIKQDDVTVLNVEGWPLATRLIIDLEKE